MKFANSLCPAIFARSKASRPVCVRGLELSQVRAVASNGVAGTPCRAGTPRRREGAGASQPPSTLAAQRDGARWRCCAARARGVRVTALGLIKLTRL